MTKLRRPPRPLKIAANQYSVPGYKGVQQKHIHYRGVPEKKIVIPNPVKVNEDDGDGFFLAPGLIYPAKPLIIPTEVKLYKNGLLPLGRLKTVKCGGQMYAPVADWFDKMYDAAFAAGFKFRNEGAFRSFQSQLTLFESRYADSDTGRVPTVTRKYEGKTWYLKKGMSPSATPGTSNHGWGLAMDLAYEVKGTLTSMGGKCLDWLCANGPRYGFYLQGSDPKNPEFEAWHWQYCLGDKSPHPDDSVSTLSTSLPLSVMKLDSEEQVIHDKELEET